jgi:uncharacterized membrane protein
MIGGRLRVSSYVNWPYGHGVPYDNVTRRAQDVDRAYNGTEADLREVVGTYNVDYVYVFFQLKDLIYYFWMNPQRILISAIRYRYWIY